MPAALNIQPKKRDDLLPAAIHNFRTGPTPESADANLADTNVILVGSKHVAGAFGAMPERQPNGRKIRTDANLAASIVMTLPSELDPVNDLTRWRKVSMRWAAHHLPGKTAYAVLHLDEPGARPHIHLLKIPKDETGKINYKFFYSSPKKLTEIQESYSIALWPLGVRPNSGEERKLLAKTYTEHANPASARISKQLKGIEEYKKERLDLGRLADDLPIGKPPSIPVTPKRKSGRVKARLPKKRIMESSEQYRKRALSDIQQQIDNAQDAAVAPWLQWFEELQKRWERIQERWRKLAEWRQKLLPGDRYYVHDRRDSAGQKQIQADKPTPAVSESNTTRNRGL